MDDGNMRLKDYSRLLDEFIVHLKKYVNPELKVEEVAGFVVVSFIYENEPYSSTIQISPKEFADRPVMSLAKSWAQKLNICLQVIKQHKGITLP